MQKRVNKRARRHAGAHAGATAAQNGQQGRKDIHTEISKVVGETIGMTPDELQPRQQKQNVFPRRAASGCARERSRELQGEISRFFERTRKPNYGQRQQGDGGSAHAGRDGSRAHVDRVEHLDAGDGRAVAVVRSLRRVGGFAGAEKNRRGQFAGQSGGSGRAAGGGQRR
jgi:hypothetical protein